MLACLPLLSQAQSATLACWTTKGKPCMLAVEAATLQIPDSVAAVDLRHVSALTVDCSSANPNCLYYTTADTAVEGLPSANVVCDGVCDGLLLTDVAHFYCPMAFTATDAMLRLTPRRDSGGGVLGFSQPCNETVVLPFETDLVAPADVNGPMPHGWLQAATFLGLDDKMLMFWETDEEPLMANTPYLVRFAYGAYSTQILFCGQDKTVKATETVSVGNESCSFVGTTMSVEESPTFYRYYRQQEPYSCFFHVGDGKPMEPFRCFIAYSDATVATGGELPPESSEGGEVTGFGQTLEYVVMSAQPTGAKSIDIAAPRSTGVHSSLTTDNAVYDLQGRRIKSSRPTSRRSMLKRGVNIVGGSKVIR